MESLAALQRMCLLLVRFVDCRDDVSLHILRPNHRGALAHLHNVGLVLYRLIVVLYLVCLIVPYPLQTFRVDDVPLDNRINMTAKLGNVLKVPPSITTFVLVIIQTLDVAIIGLVWNDIIAHRIFNNI